MPTIAAAASAWRRGRRPGLGRCWAAGSAYCGTTPATISTKHKCSRRARGITTAPGCCGTAAGTTVTARCATRRAPASTKRSACCGGPLGGGRVAREARENPRCPEAAPGGDPGLSLAEALRRAERGFAGGPADPEAYASARLVLTRRLQAGVAGLPRDDFNV